MNSVFLIAGLKQKQFLDDTGKKPLVIRQAFLLPVSELDTR